MCHVREGPRRLCGRCGRVLRTTRKTTDAYPGLWWACWWEPIEICDRCRPEGMCTALRDGEYECLRCRLADGLNDLLWLWCIRPIPGWFAPLRDAILTTPDPRSALTRVGPTRAEDSQALAAFGRWLILERARRAQQGELTPPEIKNDRARILEAERFLWWLERQGGSVDDLMQTDVDAWFARRDNARWRGCDFLAWALDRGIVSNVPGLLDSRRLILPAAGQHPSRSPDSGASRP